jgi:hypothetical protein
MPDAAQVELEMRVVRERLEIATLVFWTVTTNCANPFTFSGT